MTSKPGRNEPCPCGSGRKYKNCCLEKENRIEAMKKNFPGEDDIKKYEEFADNWDRTKGPVPSYMQYKGEPNAATSSMSDLQSKMAEMDFKSLEEVQAFVNREMNAANNTPREEFLGITSSQMHLLTRNFFAANSGLVELNENINPALLEELSVIKQSVYLLNILSETDSGIKSTERGNFPRNLTQEFYKLFIEKGDISPRVPSKEEDVPELIKLRFFLTDSGLMKKQHNRFGLTKKGRELHNNLNVYRLYSMIFFYFSDRLNWLSGTRYPDEFEYVQSSLVFGLYILKRRASDFITGEEIAGIYKAAFPEMVKKIDSGYNFSIFTSGFRMLFLEEYARYLGLVERQGKLWDFGEEKAQFRTTPLFRELFNWKI